MTDLSAKLFKPDTGSGVALRSHIGASFAGSLEHIFAACAPHIELDSDRCSALVNRLRSGSREMPWLFSLHFRLIDEINQDRLDQAAAIIAKLTGVAEAKTGVATLCLGEDALPFGEDTTLDYFRIEEGGYVLEPPIRDDAVTMRANIAIALDYLRDVSPGLANELEEIITAIFVVRGVAASQEYAGEKDFEGVSALRAFGGIVCNAKPDYSIAACALVLVHEHAHNVLFALSPLQGVVTNADDELYSSPLRIDPRPMEGILHATFVLARMIYWLELMRRAKPADSSDVQYANKMLKDLTPRYYEGVETINRYGKLTDQGRLAMAQAAQFMGSRTA